jgi:WD40 repeat protein
VGDDEGTVTIIDTATRSTRLQAIAHENHLDFLVFLDERCLITKGKDGLIKVWEILEDTLKLIEKMPHESDTDLRVSGDLQYLLVGCNDGSLNLFRTSDWSLVQLGASQVEITAVAWA